MGTGFASSYTSKWDYHSMNNRVLLLVDCSNHVYKSAHVHAALTCEGRFTGGLYGVLHAVAKAILMTKATDLVICYDTKPYLRSLTYPDYKSIRVGTKDEELVARASETMGYLKQLNTLLGLPTWAVKGFECDDLIAHAAHKYRNRFKNIVAASHDSDLYQLFRYKNFLVWKGKNGLYDRNDFENEYHIQPDKFVTLLSLTGTHNEVAGINKVGPVIATRAINSPSFMRQLRTTYADLIDRNYGLIQLPHPEFPSNEILPIKTTKFRDRDLINFCNGFDISTSQAMLDAFAQISK